LIWVVFPILGQQELTLDQALSQVRQNPLYQSQIRQIQVFEGRLQQARMGPNPAFEFLYGTEAIGGEAKNFEIGLGMSKRWERGGKRQLRSGISQLELQRMTLEAENTLRLLTSQVRQAYLELQHIQKQLVLLEQHRDRMDGLVQLDVVRVEAGEIPALNAKYLKTDFTMLATDKTHLEKLRWETFSQLNVAMGTPPETEYSLSGWDSTPEELPEADLIMAFALQNRPDLKILELTLEQADLEIQMEQAVAQRDWSWSVGYLYGRDGMEEDDFFPRGVIDFTESTDHTIEAKLSIPLSISDDNSGNIAAAMAMRQVQESRLAHAKVLVRSEVHSAFQEFRHSLIDQSIYGKDLVPQLDDKRVRLESAYLLNGDGITGLITVERDSLAVTFEALDADFRAWQSVIKLEEASGGTLSAIGPSQPVDQTTPPVASRELPPAADSQEGAN